MGQALVQISGRSILGLLRFVQSDSFPADLSAVLSYLHEASAEVFEKPIRKSGWYPYSVFRQMLQAMEATQPGSVQAYGRTSLGWDAASILQILRVFTSVDALVTRGFGSWGAFLWDRHCDTGRVFLSDRGPGTASMGIDGFPEIDPIHCRLVTAYLHAMGSAVGAENIVVEQICCVNRGDRLCEFRGRWGEGLRTD